MPLTISVTLLNGRYDAAQVDDIETPEWPPHPARMFCALVAAARDEHERDVLRWLEAQQPPSISAPQRVVSHRHQSYVVANRIDTAGGNLTHPGRTNGLRARTGLSLESDEVHLSWEVDVPADWLATLDRMARRVPYFGRSTAVALVNVSNRALPDEPGANVFEPCDLVDSQMWVRVPYPGYLDALDAQFAADRPAWEVSRNRGYHIRPQVAPTAADSDRHAFPDPYPEVVVLQFRGIHPDGRLAPRFTQALRIAVLGSAGDEAPAALHGHGANGHPHVAFLALPDVGGEFSDGHLMGLAIAIPELPPEEGAAVRRAVRELRPGADGDIGIGVPDIGRVGLLAKPGTVHRPWGMEPERWRRGSKRWITATPVVLDHYPKSEAAIEDEILSGLQRVGLPEPVDVQFSRSPLQRGAVALRPSDLPRRASGRLFRHVALTFDRTVHGPVLAGAGRYLGVGLFSPVQERPTAEAHRG